MLFGLVCLCVLFFSVFFTTRFVLAAFYLLLNFFFPEGEDSNSFNVDGEKYPQPLAISNSCLAAKVKFNSTEIVCGFSMFPKTVTVVSLL